MYNCRTVNRDVFDEGLMYPGGISKQESKTAFILNTWRRLYHKVWCSLKCHDPSDEFLANNFVSIFDNLNDSQFRSHYNPTENGGMYYHSQCLKVKWIEDKERNDNLNISANQWKHVPLS